METENATKEKEPKKRTAKQIAALICVILLAAMYVLTLIVACLDFPGAENWFAACLFATIGLPILLWVYFWLYQLMKEKRRTDTEQEVTISRFSGKRK